MTCITRVHGHNQHHVYVGQHVFDCVDWCRRVERNRSLGAKRFDKRKCPLEMNRRLLVNANVLTRPWLKRRNVQFRLLNHQMNVER